MFFHRSPNQNHEELEYSSSNLDLLLSNSSNNHPNCTIPIDHFNAECSEWCSGDNDL